MIRRRRPPMCGAGGASSLEFVVVGLVMAILSGVLLQRLHLYRQQAELAAVQRTVGFVRAALNLKAAQLVAQGREDELEVLAKQNPIDWLDRPPPGYAGEYFAPDEGTVPNGYWYFDRKRHLLVYLLNFANNFPPGTKNAQKYKVELLRRNNDFNRPTRTPAQGIALVQVDG